MHSIGNGNRTVVYDGKIAGLYDLEETLGSGHFAVVKLARHVFTGEKVAVKVIDKTKLDEVSRAHLFQEVRCMKLVQHPNVVRLYEVIDTQTKLYLILELGDGGDLYDYIMKHEGGLSENLAREYFRQIVRAISYCHQLHVVHRDLKPENVVFFEKLGVVKLTDFGFSNKFCPGQKLETSCGSLAYSAPEILLGDSYDAPAVDIWSLGVILYMLVCGQPPFEKANDSETLTMIMDCKYTMPSHVSPGCRRLISMMLVREPEKRANLTQIAADTWLQQGSQQQQDIIPEYLPLVSRQQVSDDDHTLIINKMVSGNIATKEEILDALDRNEYNHITATYFLLAERKLRQQRQEQLQKRRPDLSLPVSSSSRLSPRSRPQSRGGGGGAGINHDTKTQTNETSNHLLNVPTSSQLCTPQTPGTETASGGRSRKCSIVQEEEDDEDEISGCTSRDELTAPLNRRGSRSEGRINIAIQDRVDRVECERLKKEKDLKSSGTVNEGSHNNRNQYINNKSKGLENISGIKIINKDSNNVRLRLGAAGASNRITTHHHQHQYNPQQQHHHHNILPTIEIEKNLKISESSPTPEPPHPPHPPFNATITDSETTTDDGKRKYSVDHIKSISSSGGDGDLIQTKFLVDSSTIQIPIGSGCNQILKDTNIIPKYKTMPSPTRPTIILSGPGIRPLNEIFEEGTDVGSSDTSATTTPRPVVRSSHFTSRTSSNTTTPQRKSKFHKTRTPSCSSSDASDDDSESRKKRAHKIVDVTKPLKSQRRDSHDDSSDSQDQGNAPSSGGASGNASSYLVSMGGKTSSNQNNSDHHQTQNDSSTTTNTQNSTTSTTSSTINGVTTGTGGGGGGGGYCDKTEQQQQQQQQQQTTTTTHYRRHRAGRRRAGETRLRESQSLNRITEVQETTEIPQQQQSSNVTSNHSQQQQQQQQQQQSQEHKSQNHNNNNNYTNNITNTKSNNINNINNNCINGTLTISSSSIGITTTPSVTTPTIITKPKGLSARLFQGFIRKNDIVQQQQQQITPSSKIDNNSTTTTPTTSTTPTIIIDSQQQQQQNSNEINCGKMIIGGVDFSKAISVTATCETVGGGGDSSECGRGDINHSTTTTTTAAAATKGSSTTKKLKMLGRYFQVHKKICIPLPGLFQKGRLYKAQSCGSLVRDKQKQQQQKQQQQTNSIAPPTTTTTDTIETCNNEITMTKSLNSNYHQLPSNTRNSAVLFADKSKILRNCLSGKFNNLISNNYDKSGDINQNQNNHIMMMKSSSSSTTTTTAATETKNSTTTTTTTMKYSSSSSLNHLMMKRNSISSNNDEISCCSGGRSSNYDIDDGDGGGGGVEERFRIGRIGNIASGIGNSGIVAAAAASLLQQFCSSIPSPSSSSSSSPSTPSITNSITTTTNDIIEKSTLNSSICQKEQTSKNYYTNGVVRDCDDDVGNCVIENGDDTVIIDTDDNNDDVVVVDDNNLIKNSSFNQIQDVPLCSSKC